MGRTDPPHGHALEGGSNEGDTSQVEDGRRSEALIGWGVFSRGDEAIEASLGRRPVTEPQQMLCLGRIHWILVVQKWAVPWIALDEDLGQSGVCSARMRRTKNAKQYGTSVSLFRLGHVPQRRKVSRRAARSE